MKHIFPDHLTKWMCLVPRNGTDSPQSRECLKQNAKFCFSLNFASLSATPVSARLFNSIGSHSVGKRGFAYLEGCAESLIHPCFWPFWLNHLKSQKEPDAKKMPPYMGAGRGANGVVRRRNASIHATIGAISKSAPGVALRV